MRSIRYISSSDLIVVLLILYFIMPIVTVIIGSTVTIYSLMIVIVILTMKIFFYYGRRKFEKNLIIVIPFMVYGLLNLISSFSWSNILLLGYQYLLFFFPVLLGLYINDKKSSNNLYYWITIISIVITLLTTIRGVLAFPSAARLLATGKVASDGTATLLGWKNVGGYDFVYSIVLLYPLLILAYKRKRISLFFTIVSISVILSMIIITEYTTALLLFSLTSILFVLKKSLSTKQMITFLIVAFVVGFIMSSNISRILLFASRNINSNDISMRLQTLAAGENALMNSEDDRLSRFIDSLNTFFKHPLFGSFFSQDGVIGEHSFIADSLGRYGLIGMILIVSMYKRIYVYFYSDFKKNDGFGFVVWFLIQAVILSIINTGMWLRVLSVLGPIIIRKIYDGYENMQE